MLAALQRHHGAEHRQPQEQDGGEFVGPDQRAMGDAADHAGEQHDDLRQHQQRRRDFDHVPQDGFQRRDQPAPRHRDALAELQRRQGARFEDHARLPTDPSSVLQAWAPNFSRHSL
jgi:hypothetical protein